MAPLFSIILPTYNRAHMLRAAVKSVLAQSCRDFECFVLDDGSTDETPRVFAEFQGESLLHLQRFPDNRRQHVRRNWALGRAQGRFVAFLDSDDIWLPDRLEVFGRVLAARPAVDFLFSNAWLWRDNRIIGTLFDADQPLAEGAVPGWYAVGHAQLPYLTSNLAIRRSLFDRVGRFREDMEILEDTELYARMLKDGACVGAIRRPLAVRRLHAGQITHDHEVDYREALMALEAGGAPQDVFLKEKERLALASAGYLWRALRPREARQFLLRELGDKASSLPLYWLTFLPFGTLAWAKELRRRCLMARHHPAWACPEIRGVYRLIDPLLAQEKTAA